MSSWELYKLVLLLQILFPGKNLTFCETGGQKGYTGVGPGYRPDHGHKGGPDDILSPRIARRTHYGRRISHNGFVSPTGKSHHGTGRLPESDYYQYGEGGKYKSAQSTSTFSATLIDIDITNKRSTGKVKYYWDEENETEVYCARDNFLIARVLKGDKVLWKAKDGNYPVMVSVGVNERGKPKLTVLYPSEEEHHLKSYRKSTSGPVATGRAHKPAHPVDYRSRPVRHDQHYDLGYDRGSDPVILDIRTSGDTEEFKYYHDIENNMLVFTANAPYAFHSIVKGDKPLWKAKCRRYPVKVTVDVNKRRKPRITVFYPREDMYTPPTPLPRVRRPGTALRERVADKVEPTVTPVELDIETDGVPSNCYDHVKDDKAKAASYACKRGYGFTLVKQGDSMIWEPSHRSQHADKVVVDGIGENEITVTVYFPDGDERVFNKPGSGRPWTEIQHQPPAPEYNTPEVKITTVGMDGTSKENYATRYNITKVYGKEQYEYIFKPHVKCTLLKHNDKAVWKHSSNKPHPRSILYNRTENTFRLIFETGSVKYGLDSSSGKWVITTSTLPLPPKYHPKEVKVSTTSSDGTATDNDSTKYNVYKGEGADIYTYKFDNQVNCTRITHNGDTVWKDAGFSYPDSFIYNKRENAFLLWFFLHYKSGSTLYSLDPRTRSWTITTSTFPVNSSQQPPEVEVTTVDSDGKTRENDTTNYQVHVRDRAFTYTFKRDFKCTRITYYGKEVWKLASCGGDSDNPDSFTYNKKDNTFLLWFGLDYVKFTRDRSTGSWTGGERESIVKLTTEGSAMENDSTKYKVCKMDQIYTYKFKRGVECTMVKCSDKEVWKRSDNTVPISLSYDKSHDKIIMNFKSGSTTYSLGRRTRSWTITTSTFPLNPSQHPKEVQITIAGSTCDNDTAKYNVTKIDKDIFEYTFNKNVKCTRITHKGKEVWKNIGSLYPDSFIYNKTLNTFLLFSEKKSIKYVMLNGQPPVSTNKSNHRRKTRNRSY